MTNYPTKSCTAFADTRRIASGDLADVALAVKALADSGDASAVVVFDDETARPVELDLRGSADDVLARHAVPVAAPRTPGRPKLGVVAREVTLLPRHWEWLAAQSGGASATLRKLVEQARRSDPAGQTARESRDNTYRFATALAGNEPGFEEAMRALYAGDRTAFEARIELWPADVRDYARQLAAEAFPRAAE